MSAIPLWLIVVGIVAALAVVGTVIAVAVASNRQLPAAKTPEAIETPTDALPETTVEESELPVDETVVSVPEVAVPAIEVPTAPQGRLARLRARLARSQSSLGRGLMALLGAGNLTEEQWEDIEDTLLVADVGVGPATELVDNLRDHLAASGSKTQDEVREILRAELITMVDPDLDRSLNI